jgi:hypothetical protein
MTRENALRIAAQCWCKPETEHIEMIPELAQEFANVLFEEIKNTTSQYEMSPELVKCRYLEQIRDLKERPNSPFI